MLRQYQILGNRDIGSSRYFWPKNLEKNWFFTIHNWFMNHGSLFLFLRNHLGTSLLILKCNSWSTKALSRPDVRPCISSTRNRERRRGEQRQQQQQERGSRLAEPEDAAEARGHDGGEGGRGQGEDRRSVFHLHSVYLRRSCASQWEMSQKVYKMAKLGRKHNWCTPQVVN